MERNYSLYDRLQEIPRELRPETLLFLPYSEIVRLCDEIPYIEDICNDINFWAKKANQYGVSREHFIRITDQNLSPSERYLQYLALEKNIAIPENEHFFLEHNFFNSNQQRDWIDIGIRGDYDEIMEAVPKYKSYTDRVQSYTDRAQSYMDRVKLESLIIGAIRGRHNETANKLLEIASQSGLFNNRYHYLYI